MASSDVFRSSPPPATRREQLVIGSSSPDLPPLQQFLSTKPPRPPLRSGNRAAPIPDGAPTSFVSARIIWQSTETALETPPAKTINPSVLEQSCETDASVLIIETPQQPQPKPKPNPKPRNPRAKKVVAEPTDVTKGSDPDSKLAVKGKARKKSQPKVKNDEQQDVNIEILNELGGWKDGGGKSTDTANLRSEPNAGPGLSANAKQTSTVEPLDLEFATVRKVDWTPPSRKTVINLDSDCSTAKQLAPNCDNNQTPTFKNLLKEYTCVDSAPQAATAPVDEDLGFLKKRKRIELVKDANPTEHEIPKKLPTKRKAPKKKPRTITELATAAYKTSTQLDDVHPSGSVVDHFPSNDAGLVAVANDPTKKGRGNPSSRKRPSRATKKKAAPPKPILLSPGAALDQVAKQNFLFGTSSQLAREPSPTTLRGVQSAIRRSNQDNFDDFTTPINSDAVEPPEQRPRLWDAAARDAEGDLFDIEVVNLIESSPQLPQANAISDPFGYFRNGGQGGAVPLAEVAASESTDSFINMSDILPSTGKMPVQSQDGDSLFFSGSDASASNKTQNPAKLSNSTSAPANQPSGSQRGTSFVDQPSRPKYELLTDVQLAKEVKTYGFKPIKRRSAMISLLDQCWQSKVRIGQADLHTSAAMSTTASKPTETNNLAPTISPGKRPQGRPRKNSVSASEPQEPPPSAQPLDTPKRPRGRPRKDSASPSPVTKSRSKPKLRSPKRGVVSPGRKKSEREAVIEIPDSASDNGSNFASSPDSSVEQMFSSPPTLDLSLSVADDTDLSLSASPNDQQAALFDHITEAIKSTPRTTDPANPSWHEKILLYDPIVLEDLAAWLNSGELTRIGFDGEVSPGEVKKWCESKSVCCLWKVNLRGKERKRL